MSARRARRLLWLYPRAWRVRYGAELEALLTELSEGERISWRTCLDVGRAGLGERLRAVGLGPGAAPHTRARTGALLVLCAWMLFAVAGARVQKLSEHWQGTTPPVQRALPSVAFAVLEVAAAIGGTLVLAGVTLALPRALAYLRSGGWPVVRRAIMSALTLSALAICATATVGIWARHLDTAQRNGGSPAYGLAFVVCALLLIVALAAWTSVAVALARRIELPNRLLRTEALLAGAIGASMLVMTLATATWWGALARTAPWVLHGQSVGSPSSPFALSLFAPSVLMVFSTCVAAFGAVTALGACRRLSDTATR